MFVFVSFFVYLVMWWIMWCLIQLVTMVILLGDRGELWVAFGLLGLFECKQWSHYLESVVYMDSQLCSSS